MRRPASLLPPLAIHRPAGSRPVTLARFLPEILICTGAIALSFGLRIVAFLH